MSSDLTAKDLWPLVQKLPHEEQIRLAQLAMRAAAGGSGGDADLYAATPPSLDEFESEESGLAWDADGWDEFHATR
jgi:hypothetical protein